MIVFHKSVKWKKKVNINCAGGQSLKSFGSSKVKTAKVIAVAQTQLNFIKPTQTGIPLIL